MTSNLLVLISRRNCGPAARHGGQALRGPRNLQLTLRMVSRTGSRGEPYFGAEEATSFWKRGSLRSESNIGSSRSNAGVSGGFAARGASYGIESSFC